MEAILLIKSIVGLIVILVILVFFLLVAPKSKKKKEKIPVENIKVFKEEEQRTDLEYLLQIIKNKKTDAINLKEALELILKHHGTVHKKLGIRSHPDFDVYEDILFTICRHPNTNKNIIVDFDKELIRLNPQYKREVNNAVEKGLKSRGL